MGRFQQALASVKEEGFETAEFLYSSGSHRADFGGFDCISQEVEVDLDAAEVAQSLQYSDEAADSPVVEEYQLVVGNEFLEFVLVPAHQQRIESPRAGK